MTAWCSSATTASLSRAAGAFLLLALTSGFPAQAQQEQPNCPPVEGPPRDWIQVILNPTFPMRFAHMVTAAYLTTAIVVLSVGARYLLAHRYIDEGRILVRMSLGIVILLAPLQLFIGHGHVLDTARYQPAKLAAVEAH